MNPPCTLCGSTMWPIKDDPCPLCRAPDDQVDDDPDHDSHDDERYDDSENRLMKTDTETLIAAMRILAQDIKSEDGIANAVTAEAADRIMELHVELELWKAEAKRWRDMYMEYDEMLEGQVREAVERLNQIWEDLDDLKQKVQDDLLND